MCRTPAWSPDGGHVAFRGVAADGAPEDAEIGVYVVPAGGGAPRNLAEGLDLAPQVTFGSDLEDWRLDGGVELTWDGAGAVLCPVNARGTARCGVFRSTAAIPARSAARCTCAATRRKTANWPFWPPKAWRRRSSTGPACGLAG